jgi:opacity protein-like surface antigen
MMRIPAATAVLALGLAAAPLQAQNPGLPVYNNGVPTGIGIAADIAFPNDNSGLGTSFGATGAIGLGPLGFTASLSRTKAEATDDNVTAVGGTANLKVFGGPLIPLAVTLQGGLAYWQVDAPGVVPISTSFFHVPVGVGFVLTIPNPAFAIKPWVAPRVDIVRASPDGGEASTSTAFAWSAGVDLAFLGGLGLRGAYDWRKDDGVTASSISAGVTYTFKVPGL